MSISISQELKRCTKCKTEYPATVGYFRYRRDTDKLFNICRACEREDSRKYRRDNPEYQRKWRESNRKMVRESARRWSKANPEKTREYQRRYCEANRERLRKISRKYQKANPDKMREHYQRREARKRSLSSTLTLAEWENILASYNYACAYCGKARHEINGVLQQDHIIPLSRGGDYTADNIVPACKPCNLRKGNKTPEEAGMMLRNR